MNVPGFTPEALAEAGALLDFANSNFDWQRQFETGKGPGRNTRPDVGPSDRRHPKEWVGEKDTRTKRAAEEMLSGPALPKGPANPQGGSSKEVFGLRAFADAGTQQAPAPQPCPPKRPKEPKQPTAAQPPQPPQPPWAVA